MDKLAELARRALEEAGGRAEPVPGAKVANYMVDLARQDDPNFDFRRAMRSRGITLKALLRRLPDVHVLDKDVGDFLAGIGGAIAHTDTTPVLQLKPRYLRRDVFKAFTNVTNPGYSYLSDRDKFVPRADSLQAAVLVPPSSYEELAAMRARFAEQIADSNPELADRLRNALQGSNPLKTFRSELSNGDFELAWRDFQSDQLRPNILNWAAMNEVQVRESWFSGETLKPTMHPRAEAVTVGRVALRTLLERLSDEDLKSVMIPLRLLDRFIREK